MSGSRLKSNNFKYHHQHRKISAYQKPFFQRLFFSRNHRLLIGFTEGLMKYDIMSLMLHGSLKVNLIFL